MQHHLRTPPQRPTVVRPDLTIPEEAEQLVMDSLSKRPENRPQTMEAFLERLRRCFGKTFYRRDLKKALHKYRDTVRRFPVPDDIEEPPGRAPLRKELDQFFQESKSQPKRVSQSEFNRCVEKELPSSERLDDDAGIDELRRLLREDAE
jgi:hypothetical protein